MYRRKGTCVITYRATREFPKEEMYGLISQMRRAAVSIPSNIVEECTRESQDEYLRFFKPGECSNE